MTVAVKTPARSPPLPSYNLSLDAFLSLFSHRFRDMFLSFSYVHTMYFNHNRRGRSRQHAVFPLPSMFGSRKRRLITCLVIERACNPSLIDRCASFVQFISDERQEILATNTSTYLPTNSLIKLYVRILPVGSFRLVNEVVRFTIGSFFL